MADTPRESGGTVRCYSFSADGYDPQDVLPDLLRLAADWLEAHPTTQVWVTAVHVDWNDIGGTVEILYHGREDFVPPRDDQETD